MVEQQFRIAEIEVAKSPTDEKIVGLFRFDQQPGRDRKGTTLLIFAEIASTTYVYERLLDVINETAEQARHLLANVEQDPLARFEKLVQRLNEAVAAFSDGEPNPVSWNRINIFIVELSTGHVCLTGRGQLMNVFFQKQPDGTFRSFDLFGSLEQSPDVDPHKPFPSLICGDVKPGDVLIAGTTNFERIRNELQFKERLTSLPPVTAALEIKQDIEHRGTPDDFVAAIITCCELEMPRAQVMQKPDTTPEVQKSVESLNRLRATEDEATQHLSPPPILPKSKNGQDVRAAIRRTFERATSVFTARAKRLVSQDRLKDVAAMTSLRGMSAGHKASFDRKKKITTAAITGAIILLVSGILYWRHSQRVAADAAIWQAAFDQAQDNRNRAESDLIYGNDSRAQKEIETAEKLVAKLDATTPAHTKALETIKSDLTSLRERMRKITTIDTPVELMNVPNSAPRSLAATMLVRDTAYVADNANHVIWKVDVNTKASKQLPIPAGMQPIVSASRGKSNIIFAAADGKLLSVNTTTDTVSPLTNNIHASTTTDLVLYGTRAYMLDGGRGQVYRASNDAAGFGVGSAYIKASNTSLVGAVGIAIDSNVYILMPDGTVNRFLSGGQEGFSLMSVDPPLRSATDIWTTADATHIAITDPDQKRVLIFNKDGSLKAQLTSSQFTDPRGVDADEAAKRMLIIDGNRLLLIPIP